MLSKDTNSSASSFSSLNRLRDELHEQYSSSAGFTCRHGATAARRELSRDVVYTLSTKHSTAAVPPTTHQEITRIEVLEALPPTALVKDIILGGVVM